MLTSGIFAKSIMVTLGRWARSHHGAFLCRVAAAKRNAIICPWSLVLAKLRCKRVHHASPERHGKNRRLSDKFRYRCSFFAGCSYGLSSIVAWTSYNAMMSSSISRQDVSQTFGVYTHPKKHVRAHEKGFSRKFLIKMGKREPAAWKASPAC